MGMERCCIGVEGNWSVNVYVGILSGTEHLSGNAPSERRRGGSWDGQTERSRSLLDRASVSTVSGHSLCMGNTKLFLALSKVAGYLLAGKPPKSQWMFNVFVETNLQKQRQSCKQNILPRGVSYVRVTFAERWERSCMCKCGYACVRGCHAHMHFCPWRVFVFGWIWWLFSSGLLPPN